MSRFLRTYARVDLRAVRANFKALRSCLPEGVKALATVKADAYGHGSIQVSLALEEEADYFAVACLEEALTLRKGGIRKPILILSYTHPSLFCELIANDITATIYRTEDALLLSEEAVKMGKKARVHLAVDTGMGRIGFSPDEEGAKAVAEIFKLSGLEAEGIFSHLARADERDKSAALLQRERFDFFLQLLEEKGCRFSIRHLCNSAGTMEFPEKYDMCRFGISLYGLYPSQEMDRSRVKLTPAMEVISHVIHVKTVPAGTPIGYGHTYIAPAERRIATVSIGYADGFNRSLSGKGFVLIRGKRAAVVGRVCMDQIMVDVTEIPDAVVGDEAVILGKSGEEEICAEDLGEMAGSFHYEVVCNFMPRVTRVYLEDK